VFATVLTAAGMGFPMAPANDSIMGALPADQAGVGSAVNDTTREIGGVLGVAVLGSVASSTDAHQVATAASALPHDARRHRALLACRALPAAQQIGGPTGSHVADAAGEAFIQGVRRACWSRSSPLRPERCWRCATCRRAAPRASRRPSPRSPSRSPPGQEPQPGPDALGAVRTTGGSSSRHGTRHRRRLRRACPPDRSVRMRLTTGIGRVAFARYARSAGDAAASFDRNASRAGALGVLRAHHERVRPDLDLDPGVRGVDPAHRAKESVRGLVVVRTAVRLIWWRPRGGGPRRSGQFAQMTRLAGDDRLLTEGMPGYEQARRVWNAMVDSRPRAIVRCESAEDVAEAVRFGR
jgi:hypothetical protein